MRNIFNTVQVNAPKINVFDLSHDVKMSAKMGGLYPCLALECVPGDRITLGCDSLIRFAPMLAPIMHRVDISIHYWFVPHRITFPEFEEVIAGEDVSLPFLSYPATGGPVEAAQRKFLDYFGLPPIPPGGGPYSFNALAIAAYQKIYNEWYRDQNQIVAQTDTLIPGNQLSGPSAELMTMRLRAWEHDYFTAAAPTPQKGAAVDIPLGDVMLKTPPFTGDYPELLKMDGSEPALSASLMVGDVPNPAALVANGEGDEPLVYDPKGTLSVSPTSINDLRRAYRLQEWLERNMRGGTRYTELILAHFGVRSSDARLQRPEYITGVKSPVVISEVLNSTGPGVYYDGANDESVQFGSPQGSMAGHGVGVTSGKMGRYFCEEHGYIIGILSVLPKTAYQQGIPKHFLKADFLDYYFPSFANLGEQEVVRGEIYVGTMAHNTLFGYVPRYAEYKYCPSRVAGDFRTTLDYWHLGRIFGSTPELNQEFIECHPEDVQRIFAVQDGSDNLWMHVLHRIKAVRPMPKFGTPTI